MKNQQTIIWKIENNLDTDYCSNNKIMEWLVCFKDKYSVEERRVSSTKILNRGNIPVIIASDNILFSNYKFAVPKETTIKSFMNDVKSKFLLGCSSEQTIFVLTENNVIPKISSSIEEVYLKHKNVDGMLYFILVKENAFGC